MFYHDFNPHDYDHEGRRKFDFVYFQLNYVMQSVVSVGAGWPLQESRLVLGLGTKIDTMIRKHVWAPHSPLSPPTRLRNTVPPRDHRLLQYMPYNIGHDNIVQRPRRRARRACTFIV